jgi:hypothetical protein
LKQSFAQTTFRAQVRGKAGSRFGERWMHLLLAFRHRNTP